MPKSESSKQIAKPASRIGVLQQRLESIWYKGAAGKQWLYPLELLYRGIARLDRLLKRRKIIDHAVPVIIVGNISVGGTGKTPLVVFLCDLLKQAGYSPGIITRGYGGNSAQGPVLVGIDSDSTVCGDEPVLMAQRSGVPVVAGPNRNADIQYLLAEGEVDVVISDDGLQHYRLQRDIEIAVIDQSRGLGNKHCLPAGPLREPASRLDSCDFIVINEVEPVDVYSMQLMASKVCRLNSLVEQPLSNWDEREVHAVTGIGNPSRFFYTLKNAGLAVIEHAFPDHYAFVESDIDFADELPVVMTEKDAVKCRQFAMDKHWYLPVSASLSDRFSEDLLAKLAIVTAEKLKNQND